MAKKTNKAGATVTRKEFQLSAVTTLYLAMKLHRETNAKDGGLPMPSINAFVELGRGLFSIETIESTERSILATLDWLVHPPTTIAFIASLLCLFPKKFKCFRSGARAIYDKARYLTELSVCVSTFSFQFKSSQIAFAAILCSVYALRQSVPLSQEAKRAFLTSVASATSLSPSTASVQRACTMLMEVCPSISDRPDDVLSGLSGSTSIQAASEKVTPKADTKIPVYAEVHHVEEFIPRKRSRTKS
jgi:lipoyl(octanoyl) transferase